MTMLEIMKNRLPEGVTLSSTKETSGKYNFTFEIDGKSEKGSLPKTCSPGKAEYVVDFTITTVMISLYLKSGNLEQAKLWHEKQMALGNFD